MKRPKSFMSLVVWTTTSPETLHYGMTYTFQHGFFDPITNRTFESVGLEVGGWYYQAVPLWIGARVFHRKRATEYAIVGIFHENRVGNIKDVPDGGEFTMIGRGGERERTIIQRSTEMHSPEWAVYENDEGMAFARPLSEFTEDRFKILYNGA